ncbi:MULTISPECIES: acetate--CoA ligase [Myroides]|uniref:Acetyl-coenzyme A synthetase n=2 Tax=Myroides odoratimimus TaxID=76832 RepID=A0A0S7EDH7_9FLAO|nr:MULTISPECIES: acetate--CoA ligase [Myroides]AJA70211.1 acetate--CoA ligase [Myroides sp. A21]ALU28204.1 acetyl-coenzyme A synthetase [Myroides odoratimimus]APA93484.1 acetate--CoA ligase [Myroides sp. ZB35]EHO09051.1 acetate-CoA ligase [Myroides odoratimimus CCUG 12901]EHO11411.1 acetate-CoA ligase [Myroides odoratimimus CIP 101113]
MSYYKIENLEQYFKHYKKSVREPRKFWGKIAEENFVWYQVWDKVFEFDMEESKFQWFVNAKLNIVKNCIDRHLAKRGEKAAIIFEPNNPEEQAETITYNDLYNRVCKMANVLKEQGVKKGDRVCIYLPMIPELAVSMLACARLGAIHSVIFAGFSSSAVTKRINDSECKFVITSDGSFRGNKTIPLKPIIDEALDSCPGVEKVLVVKRTGAEVAFKEGRDMWLAPLLEEASNNHVAQVMDAEDPLFILYTSGSTGAPKGMVHTTAGYMVQTAYSFKNIFDYKEEDIFWCTADCGWITGHSYIIYGPLLNGATTVMFEGVPSYPTPSRFWDIIDKYKVTQFYTAPTAIRSLMTEDYSYVNSHDLSSLRVIGSVGEPINEEAWHWYNDHVGKKRCPIVDTWWQTETGSILVSPLPFITPTKPTYATLPLPGIQAVLMDEKRNEIEDNQVDGSLCIKFPWPSMARTIWGDHERYKETYFGQFPGKYFTGDGALRDEVGYYRITGRADDVVIVSGHNLGTAPIEDAINEHPAVAESAVVGYKHDIKGNALYGFITLKVEGETRDRENLKREINQYISSHIGPIAKLDKIQFVDSLPKTRSGKIMRRILRSISNGETKEFGDVSTLINPEVIEVIMNNKVE